MEADCEWRQGQWLSTRRVLRLRSTQGVTVDGGGEGGAESGNVGLWLPSARTLLSRAIVSEVGPKKMPRRSRLSINVHPGTIAQWL